MANATWYKSRKKVSPTVAPVAEHTMRRPINWALWIGLLIVAFTLFLAWRGPSLAPRDPMERNMPIRVDGKFINHPIAPFVAPGFPMGTDELGRDVYSRLLNGIRPTFSIVAVAAILRLLLGLLIGLGAGWSTRGVGKFLDALIAAALAIPLLIVALLVVVPLTDLWGAKAFILGLTLTGWGESARQVREQVRLLRGSTFVEASRALGGSDRQMIGNHVIHHLIPLLSVLFAFEVSSALLTIAGLGFIGYFVGGAVWSPISDFVAARYSGQPELGEMLKLDLGTIFFGPWRVLASGGLVFVVVLGFNLVGDGLRVMATRERQRASLFSRAGTAVDDWFVSRFNVNASRVLVPLALLVGVALVGGPRLREWWAARTYDASQMQGGSVEVPGPPGQPPRTLELVAGTFPPATVSRPSNALWSSAFGDPQGTRTIAETGPTALHPEWIIALTAPPTGGPVVDGYGNLYVAQRDKKVRSFYPDGKERWTLTLDAEPVGSPAIGPDDHIYVLDKDGTLVVISNEGQREQAMTLEGAAPASGPLVSAEGAIYTPRGNQIMGFDGEGMPLWLDLAEHPKAIAPTPRPLIVSAEGDLLFYDTLVVRLSDGTKVDDLVLQTVRPTQFFVGGDGYNYMRREDIIVRWVWDGEKIVPIEVQYWDRAELGDILPNESGATRAGVTWLISRNEFFDDRLIWSGKSKADTVSAIFPAVRGSLTMVGTDSQESAYLCGKPTVGTVTCFIGRARSDVVAPFETELATVVGGVLVPDHLYVAGAGFAQGSGVLVSLGNEANPNAVLPTVPASSAATSTPQATAATTSPSGPPLWATAWGDPQGTRSTSIEGPASLVYRSDVTFSAPASGGPTIGADGVLYFPLQDRTLLALSPVGEERWSVPLEAAPVGSAALGQDGTIYVADKRGQITTFSPDGTLLDNFGYDEEIAPTSGPVVAPDGTVYLTLGSQVVAFRDGKPLWGDLDTLPSADAPASRPLILSAEGELLFHGTMVIRTDDGSQVSDPLLDSFQPTQFYVGGDGVNAMRADNVIQRWAWDGEAMQPLDQRVWDATPFGTRLPEDAGATSAGIPWLLSANDFSEGRLVWVGSTPEQSVIAPIPNIRSKLRLIATDASGTAYLCGTSNSNSGSYCFMVEPGSNTALAFEGGFNVQGGAITPTRLYMLIQYTNFTQNGDQQVGGLAWFESGR